MNKKILYDLTVDSFKRVIHSLLVPDGSEGELRFDVGKCSVTVSRQHDAGGERFDDRVYFEKYGVGNYCLMLEDGDVLRLYSYAKYRDDCHPVSQQTVEKNSGYLQAMWSQIVSEVISLEAQDQAAHAVTVQNFDRLVGSVLVPAVLEPHRKIDFHLKVLDATVYIHKPNTEYAIKHQGSSVTVVGPILFRIAASKNGGEPTLRVLYKEGYVSKDKLDDQSLEFKALDLLSPPEHVMHYLQKIWCETIAQIGMAEQAAKNDSSKSKQKVPERAFKIIFPNNHGCATPDPLQLAALQKAAGFSTQYGRFLAVHNGFDGYKFEDEPDPGKLIEAPDEDATALVQDFLRLYSLGGDSGDDVEEANRDNIFRDHLWIIGCDQGGNAFVEVLHGKFKGYIGCIDHEMHAGEKTLEKFVKAFQLNGFFEATVAAQTDRLCGDYLLAFHATDMESFIKDGLFYCDGRGVFIKNLVPRAL